MAAKFVVFGSPKQRNLLPGVSYEDAEAYAVEVLHSAIAACKQFGVTIGLEPLGPAEADFMLTAKSAIRLAEMVESPYCKLHLDVKAMCSERKPIPDIIRDSRDWLVHFHANDPNMLGPGMGEVDFHPIFAALKEINYDGWVSVEVFKYEPSPDEIARQSLEYMRKIEAELTIAVCLTAKLDLSARGPQLSQMLSRPHQPVPVFDDVLRRPADLCNRHSDILGRHHFDRVPRANRKLVRIRLLARNMNAHLATHAAFEIDFAPLLGALHDAAVDLLELDAIDRAHLEARLAARAIVGVDNRQLFRNFFAWSFFSHDQTQGLRACTS